MTKKSYIANFAYQMMTAPLAFNAPFKSKQRKEVRTRFPRPCLNCGHMHMHANAFCKASCCKQWRAENLNQGKPDAALAAYVNSLVPSISIPDYLRSQS